MKIQCLGRLPTCCCWLAEIDSQQGSGLGLAIVKQIAGQHGATLSLDVGDDELGLRVTVSFPESVYSGRAVSRSKLPSTSI